MIPLEMEKRILELAELSRRQDGKPTQKKIAKTVGVDPATVRSVIARGYARHRVSSQGGQKKPYRKVERYLERFRPPRGEFKLCPHCGVKVQMPCLACYLRQREEYMRIRRGLPMERGENGKLTIALF